MRENQLANARQGEGIDHQHPAQVGEPGAAGRASDTIQLSQRELGNIVGAARESVNKCLREWQRSGLVRIEGTSITISDRANLENVAEQS